MAELSARFGVPASSLQLAVATVQQLPETSVRTVARWVDALAVLDQEKRDECADTIAETLESLARGDDPLAIVDEPLSSGARLRAGIDAARAAQVSRRILLSESVSADEAVEKSGRSRQNLEAMRRKGQVLALRTGRQWRYPVWQFDPDGIGGVVTGLRQVIAALRLSAVGTAIWLRQPSGRLQGARPLELLRRGRADEVVRVAEELGHAP